MPALVALSPGTSFPFKIAGSPATLNDKILKSPLVAAATDVDAKPAKAATNLSIVSKEAAQAV